MPRVKSPRRKMEYIHTALKCRGGDPITCNKCGYTGDADLIESTALGSGFLERCPVCKTTDITYKESVMPWSTDEWKGCYPSSWKGMIVPEAMSHPAKFSSKLIRRIYEHLRAEGWVKSGDKVIDPFGGVALGSLDAMRLGLEWFGVELEVKFVDIGQHNISNWELKYHKMPKWGKATLCQGDSRKLLQVLRGNIPSAAISSPPYAETDLGGGAGILTRDAKMRESHGMTTADENYGHSDGNLGNMKGDNFEASVSSPPYAQTDLQYKRNGLKENGKDHYERPYMDGQGEKNYGSTNGNLREMNGDNFDAAISSPPFLESAADGGWQMLDKYAKEGKLTVKQAKGDPNKSYPSWSAERDTSYGKSEGQLSEMEAGDFNAAISSPPFADSLDRGGVDADARRRAAREMGISNSEHISPIDMEKRGERNQEYGSTPGQLGGMGDGNFAAAISSPPFGEALTGGGIAKHGYQKDGDPADFVGNRSYMPNNQGNATGNLANMPTDGFSAAISSPPFRHSEGGTPEPKPGGPIDKNLYARHAAGNSAAEGYGASDGQLANMGEGDFDQAVSSPPYNLPMSQTHNGARGGTRGTTPSEEGAFVKYGNTDGQLEGMESSDETFEAAMKSPPYIETPGHGGSLSEIDVQKGTGGDLSQYGETEGQLTDGSHDDFWLAARQIVEQVYLALAPGGHAVWVTKRFVKKGKIVEFSDQWRQLCEAVGFKTLHWHRALLVRENGKSHTMDGKVIEHKTESKSFFRRLAEKKGSPRIDWEDVLCMVKE